MKVVLKENQNWLVGDISQLLVNGKLVKEAQTIKEKNIMRSYARGLANALCTKLSIVT